MEVRGVGCTTSPLSIVGVGGGCVGDLSPHRAISTRKESDVYSKDARHALGCPPVAGALKVVIVETTTTPPYFFLSP